MFGQAVVAHRRRCGLSQEDLAGVTGLSSRSIRDIEVGRVRAPRAATVRLLADAFALAGPERADFLSRAAQSSPDQSSSALSSTAQPPAGWLPTVQSLGADSLAVASLAARSMATRVSGAGLPADRWGSVRSLSGPPPQAPVVEAAAAASVAGGDPVVALAAGAVPVGAPVGEADPVEELVALDRMMAVSSTAVIVGPAGAGKTFLALRWAHRVSDRFPDGRFYVDLAAPAGAVLPDFLAALGISGAALPASPGARLGLYRSLLARRRILLVLDDARDADQVRPLLPTGPEAFAIVTSRQSLTGLIATDGAGFLALDRTSGIEVDRSLHSGS